MINLKHIKNKFMRKDNNEIDLHDLSELIEMGLNEQEISNELGIPKSLVMSLKKDIDRDY